MNADEITAESLAGMIDHAVLAPQAALAELAGACELACRYDLAALCVKPCDVSWAANRLAAAGGKTPVGTVVGFPHGSSAADTKAAETRLAISDGAVEIDMVLNIARLLSGQSDYVRDEIASVVSAADGRVVKVILECCYLERFHMAQACRAAGLAGAHYVKTSTGFGSSGASVSDVRFLREQVGHSMGVKAAGGLRTLADALAMIEAGADRLGTSRTEAILAELASHSPQKGQG